MRKYPNIRQQVYDRLLREAAASAQAFASMSGYTVESLMESMTARKRLLTTDIMKIATHPANIAQAKGIGVDPLFYARKSLETWSDWCISVSVLATAKTLIFDAEHANYLAENLDRFDDVTELFRLPFEDGIFIQFSETILESRLFEDENTTMPGETLNDTILGLTVSAHRNRYRAAVLFDSGAQNHVVFTAEDEMEIGVNLYVPEVNARNKTKLRRLAIGCISFLNASNVEIEYRDPHARTNAKRLRKGRKPFEGYHIATISKSYAQPATSSGTSSGTKHGHMYPVRGHLRRWSNGTTVWIGDHWRGLEHGKSSKQQDRMIRVKPAKLT